MRAQTPLLGIVLLAALWPASALAVGAIAFSQEQNGGWSSGIANNYQTAAEAMDAAMGFCQRGGTNCNIIANFTNSCAAIAAQVAANGFSQQSAPTVEGAERNALTACASMGLQCKIAAAGCDSIAEVVKTTVCTEPVFAEEQRLTATIDGSEQTTEYVAQAINYLRSAYCREITGDIPQANTDVMINETCHQFSGIFRGETVYWGACSDSD